MELQLICCGCRPATAKPCKFQAAAPLALKLPTLAIDHQPAPDRRRFMPPAVAPYERLGRWTIAFLLLKFSLRARYCLTSKPKSICRPIVTEVGKCTLAFYTLPSFRLDSKKAVSWLIKKSPAALAILEFKGHRFVQRDFFFILTKSWLRAYTQGVLFRQQNLSPFFGSCRGHSLPKK